jgi:ABC-type polysaccharide/polyol phosphate transport system ATPase subunit
MKKVRAKADRNPRESLDAPSAIVLDAVTVAFRSYTDRASSVKESALRFLKRKAIESFETFDALSNITMSIPKGSVLGIIGSNGSGKSTLLKVLAQVLRPTSGKVVVNGRVASLIELGVAFDPELNAIENIFLHGSLHKKSRAEIKEHVPEILEFAELTEVATRPIKYYSSGMVARLGFSCAVDVDPDILLIDEILGVGDERFQKKCSKVFDRFFTSGKTVVMVGHNLETLAAMSSRILLLSEGRIAYLGDPDTAVALYRDKDYRTFLKPETTIQE